MTLPPERLGDKGQRFEVRVIFEGEDEWKPYGYAQTSGAAERLRRAAELWPATSDTSIVDREESYEAICPQCGAEIPSIEGSESDGETNFCDSFCVAASLEFPK